MFPFICLQLQPLLTWHLGSHTPQGALVFFQGLLTSRKTSTGSSVHVLESGAASYCPHTLWGFSLIKMKTVLETRTQEGHRVPPLQKSLLNTTPHLQGGFFSTPLPLNEWMSEWMNEWLNPEVWDMVTTWVFLQTALENFLQSESQNTYRRSCGRDTVSFWRRSEITVS